MRKFLFIGILSFLLLSGCAGVMHELLFTDSNIPYSDDDDDYYYLPYPGSRYGNYPDHYYYEKQERRYEERERREEQERRYEEQERREEQSRKQEERKQQDGWQDSEQCGGGHSCKQFSPRL